MNIPQVNSYVLPVGVYLLLRIQVLMLMVMLCDHWNSQRETCRDVMYQITV